MNITPINAYPFKDPQNSFNPNLETHIPALIDFVITESTPNPPLSPEKTCDQLLRFGQELIDEHNLQEKVKDFCEYTEFGFDLISGTLSHFVGNLLVYGAHFNIFSHDIGEFGKGFKEEIGIGASVVEGVFIGHTLIDVLLRDNRLKFAKSLKDQIIHLLQRIDTDLNQSVNEDQIHRLKDILQSLELFIKQEKSDLAKDEVFLSAAITKFSLNSAAEILEKLHITSAAQPVLWVASFLSMAASTAKLHYAIKREKTLAKWYQERLDKIPQADLTLATPDVSQVEKLLEKRKDQRKLRESTLENPFEMLIQNLKLATNFTEVMEKFLSYQIKIQDWGIQSLEEFHTKIEEPPLKSSLFKAYVDFNETATIRRREGIKALAYTKHAVQRNETGFKVLKTKILYGVGLTTGVASIVLTALAFFGVIAVPGVIFAIPALLAIGFTIGLFFAGLHRMRTQRPLFYKHHMLFRVRLIINKVKEIFNKISLSFYSHQIKELNRSYLQKFLQFRQLPTEHSRNLYTKDCINYDEKRKKLDQQVDLYTQRLMNVRKRSERLQYELNAYKAIDFLRSLSGDQLESHLDVSKFLKDFSESLVNEEGQFDTKTIYLLQKYMGIAPHEYLNDDETVDVEKLMHATAEFLGLSEEDLVNQVKLNPIKVKYLKQKLPQSGLRTHSFSLVGQTLSTP